MNTFCPVTTDLNGTLTLRDEFDHAVIRVGAVEVTVHRADELVLVELSTAAAVQTAELYQPVEETEEEI